MNNNTSNKNFSSSTREPIYNCEYRLRRDESKNYSSIELLYKTFCSIYNCFLFLFLTLGFSAYYCYLLFKKDQYLAKQSGIISLIAIAFMFVMLILIKKLYKFFLKEAYERRIRNNYFKYSAISNVNYAINAIITVLLPILLFFVSFISAFYFSNAWYSLPCAIALYPFVVLASILVIRIIFGFLQNLLDCFKSQKMILDILMKIDRKI